MSADPAIFANINRQLDPDDPYVATKLAELMIQGPSASFDPKSAAKYAQRAVDRRPDYPQALATLGVAQYHLGRYREAIANIERARQIDARVGRVHVWAALARAQLSIGDFGGALFSGSETVKAWIRQIQMTIEPPVKK